MKTLVIALFILFQSNPTLAHGENIAGPHGGEIKMPANFHTELVKNEDGIFKVYLLDIDFQGATVDKSSVTGHIKDGKKKISLSCKKATDHFICKTTKPIKSGTLVLQTTRSGTKAQMPAEYKF